MERLTLNKKEERRAKVVVGIEAKELSIAEGAALLRLSERQVWRLLGAYRAEGLRGLVHKNRERNPVHRIPDAVRKQVVELALGAYDGANDCHITDLLRERQGLAVSRPTVRRILRGAGIRSPRRHRSPKHRSRRERYPEEGMLLQVDGSYHDWLEGRGPSLSLVGAIDDATGKIAAAVFREREDTQGYFLLVQGILQRHGIPLALYSDRHSIFQRAPQEPETLEEQLAGERRPTQLGEALKTLGIELILARSPQAKGRIERLWGTLQSRLPIELRLAGVTNAEEGNRFLMEYLPRFNQEFSVPPAQEGSAYRRVDQDLDLAGVLCFKYYRTAAGDNTVTLGKDTYQLLPGPKGRGYARSRMEIQERLDGSVVICSQGNRVGFRPAPPSPVTLRGRRLRGVPESGSASGPVGTLGGRMSPAVPEASEPGNGDRGRAQGQGEDGAGPATEARHVAVAKSQPPKPGPNHPWRKRYKH